MNKKFIVLLSILVILFAILFMYMFFCRNKQEIKTNDIEITPKYEQKNNIKENTVKKVAETYDLYSSEQYDLPLVSIVEINKLPLNTKNIVNKELKNAKNTYLVRKGINDSYVYLLLQSDPPLNRYQRHDIEFVEISLSDNSITKTKLGYEGTDNEAENSEKDIDLFNDIWEYDNAQECQRPVKHTRYDEFGDIKFIENWNYSDSNPIKYEMKDKSGNPISVLKEIVENETDYRKEHIFYDDNGKISLSISISYDGDNITRFSYYNSQKPDENVTVISQYTNGLRTDEKIYDSNYRLIKTIKSVYSDNIRKSLSVYDSEDKLTEMLAD